MTISPIGDPRFEMNFGERLAFALSRSGLSSQEMAARLEVSRNAVSSWTNGRNKPRSRDLKAFALATGYPLRWLETGEMPSSPDGGGGDGRYTSVSQMPIALHAARMPRSLARAS